MPIEPFVCPPEEEKFSNHTIRWLPPSVHTPGVPGLRMAVPHKLHPPAVESFLQHRGCFACDHIALLRKVDEVYPNAMFIDVGANLGMFSFAMAR